MSSESNNKITINIDKNDFVLYEKLKKDLGFSKNIDLFTMAALIGKFVVKTREEIKSPKSYWRLNDNLNSDNMSILKCLAISEDDDLNLLSSDKDLFIICEEYANAGIKELYKYHSNAGINFNVRIGELLLEKCNELGD